MELSRLFFREVVQPCLEHAFGGMPYAAGLLGAGSEVLGFDTEMSTDRGWRYVKRAPENSDEAQ
jgi:hypothetical protein